jgi:hypothetical protein
MSTAKEKNAARWWWNRSDSGVKIRIAMRSIYAVLVVVRNAEALEETYDPNGSG